MHLTSTLRLPHAVLDSSPARIVGSLGMVLIGYWLYWLLAVPLIEPQAQISRYVRPDRPAPSAVAAQSSHQGLELLFGPHDWERQNPVVLVNERGKLLMGEYLNLPNGTVEFQPCTMIFLADGPADEMERHRQAVVLQARKAVLLFDEAFDIKRGRIGKLTGGRLEGPIVIRSDQKQPGPGDDLWIETRDVELVENQVRTPHPIRFRLGHNHGSGRDLRIDLDSTPGKSKSRAPNISGIRSFTLARDVRLHLVPSGRTSVVPAPTGNVARRPEGGTASDLSSRLSPQAPIEVRCQGPFRFDLEQKVATFRERVDVLQLRSNGPSDQITGEMLSIHFAEREETPATANAAAAKSPAKPKSQTPRLDPQRLEMQGNPVVIRSTVENVHARGQRLEYDLPTRVASLAGGQQEVIVQRGGDEIHAASLHYQPGEPGRLGRFLAVGPGWLRATVDAERLEGRAAPDDANSAGNALRGVPPSDVAKSKQTFEANWFKELRISIDPNSPQNDVISLIGEARAAMPGMGELRADKIYAWVIRRAALPTSGDPAQPPRMQLSPDRMLASGNVQIDSVQLIGQTGQLEVWFERPALPETSDPVTGPGVAAVAAASSATPAVVAVSNTTPAEEQPDLVAIVPRTSSVASNQATPPAAPRRGLRLPTASSRPQQRFEVGGNVVRLKFVEGADDPELAELVIDGQAHLSEIQTSRPGQKPMYVAGDLLHLVQPEPTQATVLVKGQPAHVEGGGLGLTGDAIHLDRGSNALWIDGPGLMTMLVDRDLQGRVTAEPQPMEVRWTGRLGFNGQTATFEKQVVARRQQQRLHTELLQITLTDRVDFSSRPGQARPQVSQVACRGGVFLDSRTLDDTGKLMSTEQIETVDLTIDQVSGAVNATGPGWMKQVRRGDATSLDIPGIAPREAARPTAEQGVADNAETLNYLYVKFQRGLGGNLHRRELLFGDRVRAIFGPVPDWDGKLDPESPEGLGEKGFELSCDQMQLAEMPGSTEGQRFVELVAMGNTDVEGAEFRAMASRMTYSAAKEQLTLEGDGRRDAELYTKSRPNALKARKIKYWRKSGKVDIDNFSAVDLNQIPSK